jgi:hypothetical protein
MATVTKVSEDWGMRETGNEEGNRYFNRGFNVLFSGGSDPNEEEDEVLTASDGSLSVPAYAAMHPANVNYFVIGKNARQLSPHYWEVSVRYGSAKFVKRNNENAEDPLDEDPVVTFSFTTAEVQIDKTIDNLPIINSAGDVFDPPATETRYYPVLKVVRNEASYDFAVAALVIGCINDDTFLEFPAGYWMISDWSAEELWYGDTKYYKVTHEFILNPWGWYLEIMDRGWGYREGGEYKVAKDSDGERVSEPILLNGSGAQTDQLNPHWLTFNTKDEADFDLFGIEL